MKAIICFQGGSVHIHTFTEQWTSCACGNVKARWINPHAGTVAVAARDQSVVRLLGLNNQYLIPAIAPEGNNLAWQEYRHLHDVATSAPGYLFDKEKVNCWAAVVKIGRSNDVRWANDEEYAQAFPDDSLLHLRERGSSLATETAGESANKEALDENR